MSHLSFRGKGKKHCAQNVDITAFTRLMDIIHRDGAPGCCNRQQHDIDPSMYIGCGVMYWTPT